MMEPVWQGERQLLPGRQMVGRSWVSYAAVAGDPEVIQEVDVLVLFITCDKKTYFALLYQKCAAHKYFYLYYNNVYILFASRIVRAIGSS